MPLWKNTNLKINQTTARIKFKMESILIVDDDISLCTLLSEELKEVGYTTDFVTRADAVFEYLDKNHEVDIILLDLKLPGNDGFYILRKLKESEQNSKIIVLTAYADVKSAMDSSRLGADGFIGKPYDLDELIITIRSVLQQ
jgi:DNA-binding response OmpR family regulator